MPSLKRKKIRNFDILIFFPDFYRNEEEFWNDTNLEGFYQGQVIYNIVRGGRASNLELSGLAAGLNDNYLGHRDNCTPIASYLRFSR